MKTTRRVLSLSGGKDSAALAIHVRDRFPDMEYVFHDSGKELPETYDYLDRLEAILGKPIVRSSARDSFDHWLTVYGDMIPSNHRRWCTKMLKLKPFESYVGNDPVLNYVGLRADEDREGYISHKPNITPVYPFREDGLVRADILRILEDSGLGLPPYMKWGRTRSGCYFCFYQQRIEWVRLKEIHPDLFEEAKKYEERSLAQGDPFHWNQRESLAELERPERMAQIRQQWETSQAQKLGATSNRRLLQILGQDSDDDEPEDPEGCLICSV
jgi:3'-phosphoadenosine 5'-phosphosulfate sulfotransferase (PAPS reductase)/FAD synthetase